MHKRIITTGALVAAGLVALGAAAPAMATAGHGHTPVTICHNERTITVDDSAVAAHLAHGDTLGACVPVVVTPEPTPEPTTPPVTETPEPTPEPTTPVVTPEPTVPPKPADQVHYAAWVDQRGSANCQAHVVLQVRAVTTTPYVLVDGRWVLDMDPAHAVMTSEEQTRPMTDEEIAACTPTAPTPGSTEPPATEPSQPSAPSAGSVPPSEPTSASPETPTQTATPVASVADVTSGPDELAYTGISGRDTVAAVSAATIAVAIGIALLVAVRRRRSV